MSEITSIQAQVDKFALSLGGRVQRIHDALHQLARLTEVVLEVASPADDEVDRWVEEEGFTVRRGLRESRRALALHHGEGREPGVFSYYWPATAFGDPAVRKRLYALRRLYPHVAALKSSLPDVAWIYY